MGYSKKEILILKTKGLAKFNPENKGLRVEGPKHRDQGPEKRSADPVSHRKAGCKSLAPKVEGGAPGGMSLFKKNVDPEKKDLFALILETKDLKTLILKTKKLWNAPH